MAGEGAVRCDETGLAVPECSCQGCLEVMLREYVPAVFAEEIRITRLSGAGDDEPGTADQREAA